MATRNEFLTLTKLSSDVLTTRSRRNQLPFEIDQRKFGRQGYSLWEALLAILSEGLIHEYGMSPTRAAAFVSKLPPLLWPHWQEVIATAAENGTVPEVLCAEAVIAMEGRVPVCGTLAQIAQSLEGRPARLGMWASATSALAVLMVRAERESIAIPAEFWTAEPDYRPRLEPTWDAAIAGVNARFDQKKDAEQ